MVIVGLWCEDAVEILLKLKTLVYFLHLLFKYSKMNTCIFQVHMYILV